MGLKSLAILTSLLYIVYVQAVQYYITRGFAHHGTCIDNNVTLLPCYQLSQLNETLTNEDDVILILLSGIHVITPQWDSLRAGKLEIHSWELMSDAQIDCSAHRTLFLTIKKLNISSVKFIACNLHIFISCDEDVGDQENEFTVIIFGCMFNGSMQYAISFEPVGNNIMIQNSSFVSNDGAVYVSERSPQTVTSRVNFFYILDSLFLNNNLGESQLGTLNVDRVNLVINGSQFINNTSSKGGAIYASNSFTTVENTLFSGNYAAKDGGALFFKYTSARVCGSQFEKNVAEKSGGALYMNGEFGIDRYDIVILSSNMSFNIAMKGGSLCYKGITILLNSCHLRENAAEVGGAIFFQIIKSDISGDIF